MRRSWWLVLSLVLLGGCVVDSPYVISVEPQGTKIIKGTFPISLLETDSSFLWYPRSFASYSPDSASVASIALKAKDVHFVVVGGTWCGDTKRELPRFFKTLAEAHLPEENVELYGVDRTKKSTDGFTERYGITRVPTIILFREGGELGRIVETATSGMEFDLANILKKGE